MRNIKGTLNVRQCGCQVGVASSWPRQSLLHTVPHAPQPPRPPGWSLGAPHSLSWTMVQPACAEAQAQLAAPRGFPPPARICSPCSGGAEDGRDRLTLPKSRPHPKANQPQAPHCRKRMVHSPRPFRPCISRNATWGNVTYFKLQQ